MLLKGLIETHSLNQTQSELVVHSNKPAFVENSFSQHDTPQNRVHLTHRYNFYTSFYGNTEENAVGQVIIFSATSVGLLSVWLSTVPSVWLLSILQQLHNHTAGFLLLFAAGDLCVSHHDPAWNGDTAPQSEIKVTN